MELLFNYLDPIENPDLFSNYKIKKFPSLNEYAENYLANLDKPKEKYEINSNENENINNFSVKALSNDISNNDTNIQTNQISKINNKYDEGNDIENPCSNKIRTRNNLNLEYLKRSFNKRTKNSNTLSKINTYNTNFTQNYYNNTTQSQEKTNNRKNKKGLSELYKKISPSDKTKLSSPIFSAFRNGNSKNSYFSYFFRTNNNYNVDYSNLNKSVNSFNDYKINSKSFLSEKGDFDINMKFNKNNKRISSSLLAKKFFEKCINTDRDKSKYKNQNKKNKKRIEINFTESHTDDSLFPFISISNRYFINKSNSQSIKDYWKEKEIKRELKMQEIRNKTLYKELSEMRDKPQINENSRKIADKLGYNSSSNVFERLSELARNKLIFNERKINIKSENNYKIKTYKELNYQNYIERNKKGLESEKDFKTIKQYETYNKMFSERIKQKQGNKRKNKIININKYLNNFNQAKNYVSKSYYFEKEKEMNNLNTDINKNNMKNKIIKPKIMFKKIGSIITKPSVERNVKYIKKSNNLGNKTLINNNINIKKNKTIFLKNNKSNHDMIKLIVL